MSRTDTNTNSLTLGARNIATKQPSWTKPPYLTAGAGLDTNVAILDNWAMRVITVRSGVATPGFKDLTPIQRPMNAFSFNTEKTKYLWESIKSKSNPSPANIYPVGIETRIGFSGKGGTWADTDSRITSYVLPTVAEIDALDRTCRNKVRLKLKNQKVNLAQVIAERQQTINLLTNTVKRLTAFIKNLKQGNLTGAILGLGLLSTPVVSNRRRRRFAREFKRDQSQAVANFWLELQYGWKPLLSDVYGAVEALQRLKTSDVVYGRVAGVTKFNKSVQSEFKTTPDFQRVVTVTKTTQYTIKYVVYYSQTLRFSSELSSLGLTNPALIAWELMPWSFVFDWFIPIGNAISSLDATVGLGFVKGARTVCQKSSSVMTSQVSNPVWGTQTVLSAWGVRSNAKFSVTRSTLGGFPEAALPAFKNPLSIEHMLNALALSRQLFKK